MQSIKNSLWAHDTSIPDEKKFPRQISITEPKFVNTFEDLVKEIAVISYNNPERNLFYRGQDKEYKRMYVKGKKVVYGTSLYPTVYRGLNNNKTNIDKLKKRFNILREADSALQELFKKYKIKHIDKFSKYSEIRWAILQHYDVCATPLLDITSSLRVACSFALFDCNSYGIVYVLGFPNVYGSISYYVEDELVNLKLLSICPPEALRPYFQEGYLVGTFPSDELISRYDKKDVACRLIAKYKIPKDGFWDTNFTEIPMEALNPSNDKVEKVCDEIKKHLGQTFSNVYN